MEILTINNQNFNQEVIQSDKPVLVDFYANWCGPCKMMAPVVEEIANELGEKVKVGKVNIDETQELAMEYGVMSIPTLMIFEEGKVKNTLVGVRDKEEILSCF